MLPSTGLQKIELNYLPNSYITCLNAEESDSTIKCYL